MLILKNPIIYLLFFLALYSCSKETSTEKQPYSTIAVHTTDIQKTNGYSKEFDGQFNFNDSRKVSFKTGGILSYVTRPNKSLKKGEIIAKLDLTEIENTVLKSHHIFQKAKKDYERLASLFQDSIGSKSTLENARTKMDLSELDWINAKFNLTHSSILAPEDGFIETILFEEGEIVSPGKPICIFRSSSLNFEFSVTENDLTHLNLNAKVILRSPTLKTKIEGLINEIPLAPDRSNLYKILVSTNGHQSFIKKGFTATAHLQFDENNTYSIIPLASIAEFRKNEIKVFILKNNTAIEKWLSCEIYGNDHVYIKNLSLTSIISDNLQNLAQGSSVLIQN